MIGRPSAGLLHEWRAALTWAGAAVAAALIPIPPTMTERFYAAGIYRVLQPRLTWFSNQVPVALLDAALAAAVASWIGFAARDFARLHTRGGAARAIAARTITWASIGYLAFLFAWGFNYRRVRLVDALAVDASRVNAAAVGDAARVAVERLNALYPVAREPQSAAPFDASVPDAMLRALADIGRAHPLVVGRPKRTVLDPYFRRAGVDGMTDPFFLETLVSTDLLPFERPAVLAHEWAHLAGIADEGEANFVGWLACLRGSAAAQYSGWLFLYRELAPLVPAGARATIAGALAAGPRADLRAIRDRIAAHVDPRVSAVGWTMYDSYLKANRVEAGAASYGEVVRLVLGARLPSGFDPLVPEGR